MADIESGDVLAAAADKKPGVAWWSVTITIVDCPAESSSGALPRVKTRSRSATA
jgi:hypothetical protein